MAEGEEKNGIIDSMPLFAKELIAGGVTGGIAKTAVAPLERIKILFQVPNHYPAWYCFFYRTKIDLSPESWTRVQASKLESFSVVFSIRIFFFFFKNSCYTIAEL